MSVLEIILLISVGLLVLYTIYSVFFSKKKKKEKKDKKSLFSLFKKKKKNKDVGEKTEKKVEQAIVDPNRPKKEEKVEKQEAEQELEQKKEPAKDRGFKIIRKKSEIKIHKKAIKGDSRNPSITKVFENGKKIDDEEESNKDIDQNEETMFIDDLDFFKNIPNIENEENEIKINKDNSIIRYRFNEPTFKDHMKVSDEAPIRSPRLGDRTNFGSHLNVSEDNNFSGIMGVGVNKAVKQAEEYTNEINKRTMEMIRDVNQEVYEERDQSLASMMELMRGTAFSSSNEQPKKKTARDKIKDIDAETLIIAEAIIKRKHRN